MLKARIDQDLKTALLAGNKTLVTTLRGLKSVILYEEVAKGLRQQGLGDKDIVILLSREAKKRQESADLYRQGGNSERAEAELSEKAVIEGYLPTQLSDAELISLIDQTIAGLGVNGDAALGTVISTIKQKTAGQADGSRIAAAVKERLR